MTSYSRDIGIYGKADYLHIIEVAKFIKSCNVNAFIDDDGYGMPCKDGKVCEEIIILPSFLQKIPEDATHILWFSR